MLFISTVTNHCSSIVEAILSNNDSRIKESSHSIQLKPLSTRSFANWILIRFNVSCYLLIRFVYIDVRLFDVLINGWPIRIPGLGWQFSVCLCLGQWVMNLFNVLKWIKKINSLINKYFIFLYTIMMNLHTFMKNNTIINGYRAW